MSTRRVRAIALAVTLLAALAVLAPSLSQDAGHSLHHLHGLKITGFASADQSGATLRIDQPVATVNTQPASRSPRTAVEPTDTSAGRDQSSVAAPTSRAPPAGF